MSNISDLRGTIVPRSDQMNAEELLAGPVTITVTEVRIGSSDEQPISIHYENDGGRPFKPCKTCRKVLLFAWGHDGHLWAGRSMTLYNDPAVKFGGEKVGGIRISHISHIDGDINVSLTATKGKKALHTIKRLDLPRALSTEDITNAPTVDALRDNFGAAYKATKDKAMRERLKAAYDKRLAELSNPPEAAKSYAKWVDEIQGADDAAVAGLILDDATSVLVPEQMAELRSVFEKKWGHAA